MSGEPIAIVGISAIFPGDGETRGFWRDIVAGRDLVGEIPEKYWVASDYYDPDPKKPDKVYAKRGAFLSPIEFDTLGFGLPPQILPETDSAQLLALVGAKRVLDEVTRPGLPELDRSRTSVILGVTAAQKLAVEMNARIQRPLWAKAMREAGLPDEQVEGICERISSHYVPWRENTFPGLLGNVIAGRIANRFDLGGTNCVTDAACASSFAAIAMAIQELRQGTSDLVLSGGVDTFNDPFMYMCFSKTPALSPTGDCRPFSAQADGTILGEGVGLFALKRLKDAERDRHTIYAVIRGLGTSSDGRAKSVYAPLPEGQARALGRAYEAAGFSPATVELVEAHGTGTAAGDRAEFEGLKLAFGAAGRKDAQWCALGTVKSQIGHTKAAAGAAGLYKAALALHHKILPPTLKAAEPHPEYGFASSPFYLNTRARPWLRGSGHPRRAGVSSFGFGGSNYHLALEEHAGPRLGSRVRALSSELLLVSAPAGAGVAESCARLAGELGGTIEEFQALARRTQAEFDPQAPARLAVVAANGPEARERLSAAAAKIAENPGRGFSWPDGTVYGAAKAAGGGLAFLFPGQGSQYVEMGAELAMAWDCAREAWDRAQGLMDLGAAVFPRPALSGEEAEEQKRRLTQTEWAQPAIGACSLAQLKILKRLGARPTMAAGHSFGELTALCAAGAWGEEEFLKAARKRGELMAQAARERAEPGAMLAVVASADALAARLEGLRDSVWIANRNSPKECVLAGTASGIEQAESLLRQEGVTCRKLPVATAFHSPLVESACRPFEAHLRRKLREPRLTVFSNATAAPFAGDLARALGEQIRGGVRFEEMIRQMHRAGARTFLEVGPGSVLTRLVGDILGTEPHEAVALDQRGVDAATALWRGLGKASVAGVALDFSALWMEYPDAQALARDAKRGAPSVRISGANFGKPEPGPWTPSWRTPKPAPELPLPEVELEPPAPRAGRVTREVRRLDTTSRDLEAFAEIHRNTAEAHAAYHRAMAESHAAFLKASGETLSHLAAVLSGGSVLRVGDARSGEVSAPSARLAAPAPDRSLAPPAAAALSPAPARVRAPAPMAAPAVTVARPAAPAVSAAPSPAVTAPAAPAPSAAAPLPPADFKSALFEVVAEKTGYPAEMLKPEMELEADLGIDSIKRVEILSALKKRAPQFAQASAQDTVSMRSLAQIIGYAEKKSPQPSL